MLYYAKRGKKMLIQFKVNNFKSIKDTITFSLNTATKDKSNSFKIRNYKLLTSSVVYGANATGKSNLLQAIAFMRNMVLNRDKVTQSTDFLPHQPFKLNIETETASSTFEMIFFVGDVKYRYGFEADNQQVYSEWLFQDIKGKEAKLFFRDTDESPNLYVNNRRFKEGKKLKILSNHLFIWKCDQEGGKISHSILKWFKNLNFIDGLESDGYIDFTMKQMESSDFKKHIISLVKVADLGINDIEIEKIPLPREIINELPVPDELKQIMLLSKEVQTTEIKTKHTKYDKNLNPVGSTDFELKQDESIGTQKFFSISAPILDTLKKGKVLLIDELDASLHPMMTRFLIKMFHNSETNLHHAQLIFVTHDTNLLDSSLFRCDQIWFSEKDKYGATDIYSLAEFKNIKATENFEKNYLQGKYSAIPYLGTFNF